METTRNYWRTDLFGAQKQPPYWEPDFEAIYPFANWQHDVGLWAASTDVTETKQGPLLFTRLGGLARALAVTIPLQQLQHGAYIGGQLFSGVKLLLLGLGQSFAHFADEPCAKAMTEFLGFRRQQGETIDEAMSRWEMLHCNATEQSPCIMSVPGRTLLLLLALGVPKQVWGHCLSVTGGKFPQDQQQLADLVQKLTRELRVTESSSTHFGAERFLYTLEIGGGAHLSFSDDTSLYQDGRVVTPLFEFSEEGGAAATSSHGTWEQSDEWLSYDADGKSICKHCGSFIYRTKYVYPEDEQFDFSADFGSTDSDEDERYDPDPKAAAMTAGELRDAYVWARREFRRKIGRLQRKTCFPRYSKGFVRCFPRHERFGQGKGRSTPTFNLGTLTSGKDKCKKGSGKAYPTDEEKELAHRYSPNNEFAVFRMHKRLQ